MADAFLKQYGGSGADSSDCTAKKTQVLAGVTAITADSNDEAEAGTMPERGTLNRTLAAGQSVSLSEGHYTGGTVSAQSLASQTGGATAEDRFVRKGYTYWKDGALHTGTMETQSAISFSAAALSSSAIRISWKNPTSAPWEGVYIQMSTSGSPGASGGTRKYTGAGNNPHEAGGNNYVDITGLNPNTQYYFTCTSYFTGLPDGSSANVSTATNIKTLREILAPYSGVQYWRRIGSESNNARYADITAVGDNTFSAGTSKTSSIIYLTSKQILLVYQQGTNVTHNPISDEDLRTIEKYSFKEQRTVSGQNYDLGQIREAKLRSFSSGSTKYYAVQITGTNEFSGFADSSALYPIEFYR